MSVAWQTALQSCLREIAAARSETVPREKALGRLLAQTVVADRDYPDAHLSMMDGYAIDASPRESFRVEGENRPGFDPGTPLGEGIARRIFTGAELPSGATRVIPQEVTQREGDSLRIIEYPETAFVRQRASEKEKGEVVLSPGLRITAVEISILASLGVNDIEVAAKPRVAHLVTGDEVMAPGEKGEPGPRIRDSNSDLISAVLSGIGQAVGDRRRIHDDREAACRIVREMAADCDVLLISGGASVGDHDHARASIKAAGFHFLAHGLEVRPGKPVGLARRGGQWAVALPGNPVSHLVALHLFVLPLLLAMEGAAQPEPQLRRGILAETFSAPVPRRDTFWSSAATMIDGIWHLVPCRFLSSGDLLGIAGANALLYLPAGQPIPHKGGEIFFLSLAPVFFQRLLLMNDFSHLDEKGNARMVDVGGKPLQQRRAVAEGWLRCAPGTVKKLRADALPKGDVLTIAQVAGIQAAKRTAELIPLCHPLALDVVEVTFVVEESRIGIRAIAAITARTGIEMEALTAVSIAALTLYDMCKAVDKSMVIEGIRLVEKTKV